MKKTMFSFFVAAVLFSVTTGSAFAETITCQKGESKSNCLSRLVMQGHNPLTEKLNEIKRHPNDDIYGSFHKDYNLLSKEIRVNCGKLNTPLESYECLYIGQQKQMQVLKEELARLKNLSVKDPQPERAKEKPNCDSFNADLKWKECRKGKYREPQGGVM